ncbi:MAG: spore protease YyaC [Firmicutes bacterium]|nr:spore protease YyaC [Bacillota bacterium]
MKSMGAKGPYKAMFTDVDGEQGLTEAIYQRLSMKSAKSDIVVLCIGTDRSTGDSLGPLVGSYLSERAAPVRLFGTLENPVHAVNLAETTEHIQAQHPDAFTLAVDACLGQVSTVGQITLADGPLRPGAGVHKKLPAVGDAHITGIVNVGGFMEYFVLQNTRLHIVVKMAEVIGAAIAGATHELGAMERHRATAAAFVTESRPQRLSVFLRGRP